MEKETRVYVVPIIEPIPKNDTSPTNKRIIKTNAENIGSVYSLVGFQNAFNENEINIENNYILID